MKTIHPLVAGAMLTLAAVGVASADDWPVSRLHQAQSLRCTFTSSVVTWVRSGRRSIGQTNDKGSAQYDNINVAKGTARIIANAGAGDLAVWVEGTSGSLWMLERAPSGNVIVTTVFPMYAEGTNEFVALEARHSMTGQIVFAEETYGTCRVWD